MKKMGFNVSKCKIIPHGNYMGIYPNSITKTVARNILNLSKEDFVFLFFGIIREYKGIDDLLIEFSKLVNIYKENKIKLIIAGECIDIGLQKLIEKYQISLKDILICESEYILDKDVQIFFNACDVVVYPFKKITTSGSVILALSFIKPIVCPRMGGLKELPNNIGFFYNPKDKKGLLNCLEKAFANKDNLEGMEKNVLRYVKNLSWDKIAEKTYKIYKKLYQ
jgi:glycosyltransferase involved in cell wall biosynthesis